MPDQFSHLRLANQRKFLRHYAKCGSVSGAMEAAGLKGHGHYYWMKSDPEYAEAFDLAKDMSADVLESIAWERAKKSSDLLMIFLLKGLRPDTYREQRVIVGDSKSPISHEMRISVVRTDDRKDYLDTPKALGPGTDSQ